MSAGAAAFVATGGVLAGQGGNNNNQGQNGGGGSPRGAPAPAIGTGLSALLVAGGLFLGTKLFRRRSQGADSQVAERINKPLR
jgi:hypothetical protein